MTEAIAPLSGSDYWNQQHQSGLKTGAMGPGLKTGGSRVLKVQ